MAMVRQLAPVDNHHQLVEVDPARVAVPPWHPRPNWDRQNEALRGLEDSILRIGQREAILVTPAPTALVEQGYDYLVANGARRVAACLKLGRMVLADVETDADGLPLPPFLLLASWLTRHEGVETPSPAMIISCLARMRYEWEKEARRHAQVAPFPSVQRLAQMFHLRASSMWRYLKVSQQPLEIIEAIVRGDLAINTVLLFLSEEIDDQVRQDLFTRLLEESARRRTLGEPAVTRNEAAAFLVAPNLPIPQLGEPEGPPDEQPRPLFSPIRAEQRIQAATLREPSLPGTQVAVYELPPEPEALPVLPHPLQAAPFTETLAALYRQAAPPTRLQVLGALCQDAVELYEYLVWESERLPEPVIRAMEELTRPDAAPAIQALIYQS